MFGFLVFVIGEGYCSSKDVGWVFCCKYGYIRLV